MEYEIIHLHYLLHIGPFYSQVCINHMLETSLENLIIIRLSVIS